ncbi:MAG: c-type cytochrome biogenesis protein CcmI [Pseudomonadota bacterium]
MFIWILFAALTAIAASCVLIPYARARKAAGSDSPVAPGASDLQVYKDQLREIERDTKRGILPEQEAEAAKTEISRRLLRSADAATRASGGPGGSNRVRARTVLVTAFALIPISTIAIYLALGSPDLEDQPLAQRIATAVEDQDTAILIARVEEAVGENPDDVRGWSILAPIYARQGRFADARIAFQQIIRLSGDRPDLFGALGEVIIMENQGLVTTEAAEQFERALNIDPNFRLARYYTALALVQEGAGEEASPILRSLVDSSAVADPWTAASRALLAQIESGEDPLVPSQRTVLESAEAIASLPEAQRRQAIEGMVARLAERLQEQPDDLAGWSQLIRSYATLGRDADARAALDRALDIFRTDNPARLRLLTIAEETQIALPE